MALGADRFFPFQETRQHGRRRASRLRRDPVRHADTARPPHRIYFFNGHKPVQSAQELRAGREANAIGTEYVRADLLPGADAAKVRALLRRYTDQRILFYETGDRQKLLQINANTAQLQSELWSAVRAPAATQATPVLALAISGMNEVLNSQGYTQAAWWDRIPLAAWGMMAAIAICANLLVGYGARQAKAQGILMLVLPLVVSISFFLIADIDSPRGGVIRVRPQNLVSFAQSLPAN